MIRWAGTKLSKTTPAIRLSFFILAAFLLVAGWFHLAGSFLAGLFSYFALNKLFVARRGMAGKWVAVVLFVLLVAILAYGLGFLINASLRTLPKVAEEAIPSVIQWAKQRHIELPFTDYDSLRELALDTVKTQVGSIARIARGAASQFALVLIAAIIAIGVFFNPRLEANGDRAVPRNFYSECCEEISGRFAVFYKSFAMVMGAQILISTINTVLTAIFVLAIGLPNAFVVIGITFLCGLLPVLGNVVSNTIIVGIGITVSAKVAIAALIFLVCVHKLEYFLNSKIVGHRIRNPFWLTLMALVIGEKLLGIPGMVLAPVLLNYLKLEASSDPETLTSKTQLPVASDAAS